MNDTMSHFTSRAIAILAGILIITGIGAAQATAAPGGSKKDRPLTKLVTVKAPKHAGGAIRLQVRILRDLERLAVKVNGRRLRMPLAVNKGRRLKLHLDATRGVRFGRNRISVRAERGKRHQIARRSTRVRGDAPLVGVRVPRHARQHDAVRLDARATRTRGKGKLNYRWRIVAAPRRARARLKGARSARPRLRTSHQGRYLIALTVNQGRGAASTSAAKGCPVTKSGKTPPSKPIAPPVSLPDGRPIASTPLELLPAPTSNLTAVAPAGNPKRAPVDRVKARPRSATGCTTQYVSVEVDPAIGPMGVAFDSRATVGGQTGMRVGSTFYPVPSGETYALFLDANTLEELGNTVVPAGENAEAWAELMASRYVFDHQVLILLAGPDFTLVKGATESDTTAVSNEGLVEGDGTGAPLAKGQIQGWLQPGVPIDNTDQSYQLIYPDRVPINSGQGTGNTNTMTIGDQQYGATLPIGTEAGFHVVVTDPALRPILGTPSFFSTNTGNPNFDAQQQGAMANLLTQANNTTASTVVIQSLGHPTATAQGSVNIGQQIQKLGGTEWMFLALDGQHGYSLIGNTPPLGAATNVEPSPEASSQWTGAANSGNGGDSLTGILKRRHDGAFQATLVDSVGGLDYSLQTIAFQPPTDWPVTDNDARRAAATWIAQQLKLPTEGPGLCASTPKPDVRAQYCNEAKDTGTFQNQIAAVAYTPDAKGFTSDDLTAVKTQFQTELDQVADVRAAITNMQAPYLLQNGSTAVDANQVAVNVIVSIPEPASAPVSAQLGLSSSVLYAAAELPVVGKVFGLPASALDLASDLTETDGIPSPNWKIETSAAEAGTEIESRLVATYVTLADYQDVLVSDGGKLAAADQQTSGNWGQDAATLKDIMSVLQLGVKQWLYTAIVPSAYQLVQIPGADPATAREQVHCIWSQAPEEWRPWKNADPSTMFFPLNDWGSNGPVAAQMMAMLAGGTGTTRSHSVTEGSSLVEDMFGGSDSGGAALVAPWFYNRANWTIRRPKMAQPNTALKPGVCKVGEI